jgi:phage portal protein BeeE
MNPLRQTLRSLAIQGVKLFGRMIQYGSALRLPGTNVDWANRIGRKYDNSAVWAAIQYLADQICGDPRLIVQVKKTLDGKSEWQETESGLPDALENGPLYSRDQLLFGVVISLVVDGNAYWLKIRSGTRVIGYAYLPHWRVVPRNDIAFGGRPADGSVPVTVYEFQNADGTTLGFAPEDIVHFRWGQNPEPGAESLGISPIFASFREIATDNLAATLGAALLENGGIPALWISPKGEKGMRPDQEKEASAIVQRKITGDQAGTPIWAPVPADITVVGYSPDKLVLSETRSMAAERILGPLRIDPMVLGFRSQNKTYSNFEEANKAAWRGACKPMLRLISRALHKQALPDFLGRTAQEQMFGGGSDLRVWWDLSEVSEEQPDIDKEWARVGRAFIQDLIMRSEARAMIGLKSKPEDDVYFSAVKAALAPKVEADAEKPEPKDETKRAVMALIRARSALEAIDAIEDAA